MFPEEQNVSLASPILKSHVNYSEKEAPVTLRITFRASAMAIPPDLPCRCGIGRAFSRKHVMVLRQPDSWLFVSKLCVVEEHSASE